MPEINYVDDLNADGLEWLRVRIITDRGDVTIFTAQYETVEDGERLAVIRYDNAHGFAHVDILNRRGDVMEKMPLPPDLPLKDALKLGIEDIKANWMKYRQRFFGERR